MGAQFDHLKKPAMVLRDYQEYAVTKALAALAEPNCASIIAAPTGTGKSLMIAGIIKRVFETYPTYPHRIMTLTHVKELIEQNHEKLMAFWPDAVAGIYSAGLGKKEMHMPITFAGIASVYRQAEAIGRVDILMIDECHLIGTKSNGMYLSFIRALKTINPKIRILGLTATPYRVGLGLLTDGELFNDICCDMTSLEAFNWFIDEGYLCPIIPRKTKVEFDENNIRTTAGDYDIKSMDSEVNTNDKNVAAVNEVIVAGEDRYHWLVFGVSIDHVERLSDLFNAQGIKTTFIHSKMKDEERDERIAAFKNGEYRCLVNNGILTTGFDMPHLDLIAIIRLTKSPGLWVQILGRGTRPDYADGFDLSTTQGRLDAIARSDKQNCLVLDFGGNTLRLGPINDVVMPNKKGKKRGGGAPVRLCEGCQQTYFHISRDTCPDCGHLHPRQAPDQKINTEASDKDLVRKKREPKQEEPPQEVEFKVSHVTYNLHLGRNGKPNSMLGTYHCGLRTFTEYLCFDHTNFARTKARALWRERVAYTMYADKPAPESVTEALSRADEMRVPTSIRVIINKPFTPIVSYDFGQTLDKKSD